MTMDQSPLDPSSASANCSSEPPAGSPPAPSEVQPLDDSPPDMTLDHMLECAVQTVALARAGGMDTSASLFESYDAAGPLGAGFVSELYDKSEDVLDIMGQFRDFLWEDLEAHDAATDPLHAGRGAAADDE